MHHATRDHDKSHFWFTSTFRAYAREHAGELLDGGSNVTAQLIHMSRYDARLRLQDGAAGYLPGRVLQLRVGDKAGRQTPLTVAAAVQWVQGDELGLQFSAPLELGARELQNLLD